MFTGHTSAKDLTPEEVDAVLELQTNFELFCETCLYIRDKDGRGTIPFRLHEPQRKLIEFMEWHLAKYGMGRILVPKSRQQGISTVVVAWNLWRTLTTAQYHAYIMAHDSASTVTLYENARKMYERLYQLRLNGSLPAALVPAAAASNTRTLRFKGLDSSLTLGTAGSGETGRGTSLNSVHGSEVAFWEHATLIMPGLLSACSGSQDSMITLESSGQPQGAFKRMVMEAVRDEYQGAWRVFFLSVLQDETARRACPPGFEFPEAFLRLQQQYGMGDDQLYFWYLQNERIALADGLEPERVHPTTLREYPFELEHCFVASSSDTFFNNQDVFAAQSATPPNVIGQPIILGVDIGGESSGSDDTWVIDRQGTILGGNVDAALTGSYIQQAEWIAIVCQRFGVTTVAIDATSNTAFVTLVREACRRLSLPVAILPVNFGARPRAKWYANIRAELHDLFRLWLAGNRLFDLEQVVIPRTSRDSSRFDEQLFAYRFGKGECRRNDKGVLTLTPKDNIKELLGGKSPDKLDAAVLTMYPSDKYLAKLARMQSGLLDQQYNMERTAIHGR